MHATVYRTFLAVLSAHGRCGCLTDAHVGAAVHRRAGQGRIGPALHRRVDQRPHPVGAVAVSEDEKTPGREIITDYAQAHFRYFRTADGTVYAQKNGHPVARPIRSQGTTGSHRQELMVGLFHDGLRRLQRDRTQRSAGPDRSPRAAPRTCSP